LIARLLPNDLLPKQRAAELQRIASQTHTIPGTSRQRVAESTVRQWLRDYREGGFDALIPRPRADRGEPRTLRPELAERLVQIKEEHPALAVRLIIEQAREEKMIAADEQVAVSTVYRLFQRLGLTAPNAGQLPAEDRRRFAFAEAGQLWMSDVMHGPSVIDTGKRRRKTYLIAFIDDATRVITHAQFAFSENTASFLPVFKQALLRRGKTTRLYVDNGASYRSHHLSLVCAKLNIALIHARPYQPAGKGKIERFFRTCRAQLISRLVDGDTQSLDALNRRFATWLEGEYHHCPHRGLEGQTPLEKWAQVSGSVVYPDQNLDLDDLFLFETTRKVNNDRTVSLNGKLFEVDATLVGSKVTLRYNPAKPDASIHVVHQGKFIEMARQVDIYANCHVKRHRRSDIIDSDKPAPQPSQSLSLRSLKHSEELNNGNDSGEQR
jgi:transposase InsO family protein